jgi:membrane-associated phospholipid phosphatase
MNYVLSLSYQKLAFIFKYFDFLRDLFLGLQFILVLIFIINSRSWKNLIFYILIFLSAFAIAGFIKNFFPYPRPDGLSYDSFPSSHTTISFALSLTLIWQNLKLGILSLILTFLIAILSFLSLRHWPIDIFFGFIFGFLVFFIIYKILHFFHWFDLKTKQNKT